MRTLLFFLGLALMAGAAVVALNNILLGAFVFVIGAFLSWVNRRPAQLASDGVRQTKLRTSGSPYHSVRSTSGVSRSDTTTRNDSSTSYAMDPMYYGAYSNYSDTSSGSSDSCSTDSSSSYDSGSSSSYDSGSSCSSSSDSGGGGGD